MKKLIIIELIALLLSGCAYAVSHSRDRCTSDASGRCACERSECVRREPYYPYDSWYSKIRAERKK